MRISVPILVTLFLSIGCASSPDVKNEIVWDEITAQVPTGMSQIYVVRPEKLASSANRFIITINDEPVAAMKTGTYFWHHVPAGQTHLTAKTEPNILNFGLALAFMSKPEIEIETEAGSIYFVQVDVGFSGGPKLVILDPSQGEKFVNNARESKELPSQ